MSERRLARYRLLRRIGAGGMAEVFRAELEGAEGVTRALVVKRIHGALARDPEAVAMFVAEARIAARLSHPNVVQVYEFGRDADDYFLAMELVEGCDLATLVRSFNGNPAPMGLTAWVMGEILEALQYVHELRDERGELMRLVHRDVSPHNVLVGTAGEVKLADFGIAKAALRVDERAEKVKGKLAFMAPEQARGDGIDARADLFGAGAILYEMLCGARPYREREGAVLAEVVRDGDVVPIRERAPWLSDELVDVVTRAVSPDAALRFADARGFREALEEAFAVDAVRPDRAMLASAVRARSTIEGPEPVARAERTVTADDVATTPEPVAAVASAPTPSAGARWKLFAERAMIAAAVFVVAVLAERRTRPPPAPPPPIAEAAVSLRAPESLVRALRPLLAAAGLTCRVDVTVRAGDAGDAELRLQRWRDFSAAPNAFADLSESLDPRALDEARVAARSLGASPRAPQDEGSAVRFAALGVDPFVFFARRAALAALAELPADPSALRDAVQEALGDAPRRAQTPASELEGWGGWDLVLASISLRRSGFASHRVWVGAGATPLAAEVWSARAVTHDPDAAVDMGASHGVALTLGWDRVMHALDVLAIGADLTEDEALPPSRPDVAFGWAPLSRVLHADPAVWRVARPPRGDDWRLDARGEPLRIGAHLVPAELYGWTLTAEGARRRAARCVLSRLTDDRTQRSLRDGAGLSSWGAAPTRGRALLDPALREALEGPRLSLLRDPEGDPARRRDAWWSLWRDAVLGSVRGSAADERAMHEVWRARARAQFAGRR